MWPVIAQPVEFHAACLCGGNAKGFAKTVNLLPGMCVFLGKCSWAPLTLDPESYTATAACTKGKEYRVDSVEEVIPVLEPLGRATTAARPDVAAPSRARRGGASSEYSPPMCLFTSRLLHKPGRQCPASDLPLARRVQQLGRQQAARSCGTNGTLPKRGPKGEGSGGHEERQVSQDT
mmetsp:Transcript_55619/g.162608  ORF Transcript_55619/g.162608 Transcript_55619/m.162608 type:complete len:177 (+) Transcript_55619:644-1174(+)